MLVMAIDHVRDYFSPYPYSPTDLTRAAPALFLTRWITHFCAPTFVFLAGTSAFLYARNNPAGRGGAQRFLLTRGLWLVLLELTVINWSWRFNLQGLVLQVMWALGWSMVTLSALLYLPMRVIGALGLLIVFGHDLLDGLHFDAVASHGMAMAWLWAVLHEVHSSAGDFRFVVLYPVLPWIGVLLLGYCFGEVLLFPEAPRRRCMLAIGLSAMALFLLLRLGNIYGEPNPWTDNPRGPLFTALGLFNVSKYPPSLLYLLMTLGPVIALLPALERWGDGLARRITVFGRVPLFFYLIHIPLIHGAVLVAALILFGRIPETNGPISPAALPPGYEPSLLRVYAVWAVLVVALYPACRWYAGYKARNRALWWLSYL